MNKNALDKYYIRDLEGLLISIKNNQFKYIDNSKVFSSISKDIKNLEEYITLRKIKEANINE